MYADPATRQQKNKEACRRYYMNNRAMIQEMKRGPCTDCGGSFPPECMDFDHVRGEKLLHVSDYQKTPNKLLAEIAKCDLVCANCHRIRTAQRRALCQVSAQS